MAKTHKPLIKWDKMSFFYAMGIVFCLTLLILGLANIPQPEPLPTTIILDDAGTRPVSEKIAFLHMNVFCTVEHGHPLFEGKELCFFVSELKEKLKEKLGVE